VGYSDASHDKGSARFGAAASVASSDSKLVVVLTLNPFNGVGGTGSHGDLLPVLGVGGAIDGTHAHVQSEGDVSGVEVVLGEVEPGELNAVDGSGVLVDPFELFGVYAIGGHGRDRAELVGVRKSGPFGAHSSGAGAHATLEHGSFSEVEGGVLEGAHVEAAGGGSPLSAHGDLFENSHVVLDLNIGGFGQVVGGPHDLSIASLGG
jgi:hypothetical protein